MLQTFFQVFVYFQGKVKDTSLLERLVLKLNSVVRLVVHFLFPRKNMSLVSKNYEEGIPLRTHC